MVQLTSADAKFGTFVTYRDFTVWETIGPCAGRLGQAVLGRASVGERRERQARLEDVARSVFALPGRPRISRGRPLRCQRGA